MRASQVRNMLTTIALAVCCGVAAAAPETAPPPPTSESSEVKSESKGTTASASKTKKSGKTPKKKSTAKAPAKPKTVAKAKTVAPAKHVPPAKEVAAAKTLPPAKEVPAAKTVAAAKELPPAKTLPPAKPINPATAAPKKMVRPVSVLSIEGSGAALSKPGGTEVSSPSSGIRGFQDRARWAPTSVCEETHKKLEGTMRGIDKEAAKNGDRLVMARLATEFRIPAESVLSEKTRLSATWGELVVAHTLQASVPSVTIDQLLDMRAEGLGWGQISYGLGLKQKDVVTAVNAEGKVMRGQSKPDGSPMTIASMDPQPQVVGMDLSVPTEADTPDAGPADVDAPAPVPAEK